MALRIDHDACILCERCVHECPYDALRVENARVVVTDACTLCGACLDACPVDAIRLAPAAAADGPSDTTAYRGVWVVGERERRALHHVVFELLGKGRELADVRGCPLELVVLGSGLDDVAAELRGVPVDTVHVVDDATLADGLDGPCARVLAHLIALRRPEIVLAGATSRGRSLMPRVAVLCNAGLTADCTGLEIEPGTGDLLQTRPAFGGNLMATIVTRNHRPQMATVRPKVMVALPPGGGGQPPVRRWRVPPELLRSPVRLLARQRRAEDGVNIADADVLVAGGRGVGGPEGFEALAGLAHALGGELAASRAAVDAGWVPYARQVGQTGKTVHPDLYVAIGISGAVQHRAGMQSSGTIVAVNSDPDAPIFSCADFGIVADWRECVPLLVEAVSRPRPPGEDAR